MKRNIVIFLKRKLKKEIEPTKFLPLWDLVGVGLGFKSTVFGKKQS